MTGAAARLHVVFDWNGTLLDDLDLAVRSVNACAERFGVAPVDRDRYTSLFDFPVRGFYTSLGFDLDRVPWPEVVAAYLEGFDAAVADCPLHPGVVEGLERLRDADGVTVSLLSASYEPTLRRVVAHKGLDGLFDNVVGVRDTDGASKLDEARRLALVPAERTVLVGDTSHDKAVAEACGWGPHLVTCGHQSRERLVGLGVPAWADTLAFMTDVLPSLCEPAPEPAPELAPELAPERRTG